jgi:orotidine-5'-phosphate decarboxylase
VTQVKRQVKTEDSARERLIVALDVSTAQQAREIVSTLRGAVGMFKVGSQLFSAEGPNIVRELTNQGEKVFLDLKFHDIPSTVAKAATEATRLGVAMFNVHASGGREMMIRTKDAVTEVTVRENLPAPIVIAVTVLTSANQETLDETGVSFMLNDQVIRLALLAEGVGLDGVVASPREVRSVREAVTSPSFILVTPGVRPADTQADDQKRTMTPREAMVAGSSYLVVGRPITGAADPVTATNQIVHEMAAGLDAALNS